MTIIIGLEDKETGSVWMGGDSAVTTWPNSVDVLREGKIFNIADIMLFGSAGTLRNAQIIKHSLMFRHQFSEESDMDYLVNGVAESIREILREKGASRIEANIESNVNSWLLGYRGKIYEIDDSYAVVNSARGLTAIGSGRDYAMASMLALKEYEPDPRKRILKTLKLVAELDSYVKPKFHVMELKNEKRTNNRNS